MSHCFTERAVSEKLGSTLSPYAYPTASNRLASVTTGSAMRKFTYDASGDILTDSRTGALGLTFGYDEEGRLIKATQTNSTANGATYSYDAQSRLSMRTVTHSTAPTTTTGIATDVPGSLASSRGSDGHATARSMGWQTAHDIIMSWPSSRAMMQDGPSVFGYAGQNVLVLTDALGLMGGRGHQGRYSRLCGRCIVTYDSDQFKGAHTHWKCPGEPEGCIKKDGTPCDGLVLLQTFNNA